MEAKPLVMLTEDDLRQLVREAVRDGVTAAAIGDVRDVVTRDNARLRHALEMANRAHVDIVRTLLGDHIAGLEPIERWPSFGGVYFIAAAGLVKIGRSNCISDRLTGAKTFLPHSMRLLAVLPNREDAEHRVHDLLDKSHIDGEWFAINEDTIYVMREVRRDPDGFARDIRSIGKIRLPSGKLVPCG